jgi:hypothetical protein
MKQECRCYVLNLNKIGSYSARPLNSPQGDLVFLSMPLHFFPSFIRLNAAAGLKK